jgi:aspartate-semialdehyde dehydrogenase
MVNEKIPVAVLGATGSVGQKFIQLLENHPWFEIAELGASLNSAGHSYEDKTNWFLSTSIPNKIKQMRIKPCKATYFSSPLVFSGLDSSVAGEIETDFAKNGFAVVSNSKNHRMDKNVPLLIPEVNPSHLDLINYQTTKGFIVTNPNCSTIGLAIALKPLIDNFGVESVNVVTMQALSGAGYPGISSLDIIDNAIPFIQGEEGKLQTEPKKLFGKLSNGLVDFSDIKISAICNRIAVLEGHLASVQVKLKHTASQKDLIQCFKLFKGEPQNLQLPTAPKSPIYYFTKDNYPQPRLHKNLGNGMAVSVGRLQVDTLFDYKFTVLSHNTIRGAAGGAILCAELLKAKKYL